MVPTILINQVYSYQNKGDAAIVEAMGNYIRGILPDARIYLLSTYWKENKAYFEPLGYRCVPPLLDIPMNTNKAIRLILALNALLQLGYSSAMRKNPPLTAKQNPLTVELYRNADLVLDAGGGSLYSSNTYIFYLGLYQHLFNLWFAQKLEKHVLVFPQSIGPLRRSPDKHFVGNVLRRVDAVMVREPISAQLLARMHVPYTIVPDVAFLNNFITQPTPVAQSLLEKLPQTGVRIGLTVLNWSWAAMRSSQAKNLITDYLQRLARFFSQLGRQYHIHLSVFPQITLTQYGRNDLTLARQFTSLLPANINWTIFDRELSPSDLSFLYSRMHLFIGSHMHACILALNAGVPTLGLAYQPKTYGTFKLLGLEKYVFDIRNFSAEEIYVQAQNCLDRQEFVKQQVVRAARMARQSVEDGLERVVLPSLMRIKKKYARSHFT